jgi:branched-chain amino acid transport system substrate-binding protein
VRIRSLAGSAIIIATAGAMVLTGCSSSGGGGGGGATSGGAPSSGGGGGLNGGGSSSSAAAKTYKIGFIGALSGDNAQLGINIKQGAELAIDQAMSAGKYDFKVTLDPQDSVGDPVQAKPAAATLINDPDVVAVVGPAFSGESEAVNPDFCAASPPVPIVTPSASKGTLQTHGWKCWHRIQPNDNVEGAQGADWLARTGSKKVYVLDDASPYGQGVAETVAKELKAKNVGVITGSVPATTTKNYDPIANTIASSGADALFYGGYDAQAALLARSLKAAGFTGRKVGGNGIKSSIFTKNAGAAGEGWYFTCGCQDATVAPSAKAFAAAYKAKWGEDPSTYSPEGFDATNLILDAMSKAEAAGGISRTTVLTALNAENYPGITTTIKFQSDGEVVPSNLIVNLFQEKNGVIVGLGDITQLNS